MSRQPRRKRADHPPLRPIEPPALIAILIELIGCCPSCGAPLVLTPSGLYRVSHEVNCKLAADVERAA